MPRPSAIARLAGSFSRRLTVHPPKTAMVPPGVRVYAFGDVHGQSELLSLLLKHIEADIQASRCNRHVVIGLGDYVNRGPDSAGVLRLLADCRLAGAEHVFLKGNHEAMLLEFLEHPETAGPHWLRMGGQSLFLSFRLERRPWEHDPLAFRETRNELLDRLTPAQRGLLDNLRLQLSLGDYFFVHAGVDPRISLCEQKEQTLLWKKYSRDEGDTPLDKVVVHGHTPVPEAEMKQYRINVDTGAYATGRLTCVVLEGASRRLLTASLQS